MHRLATSLLLALATLLPACASNDDPTRFAGDTYADTFKVAREHAYTVLTEVRFDGETQPAGYTVEFVPLPLGVQDERPYLVGTLLVQDTGLASMGFITPGGRAFAFDTNGASHDRGYGKRDGQVAGLLGRHGRRPRYQRISPLDG